MLNFGGGTTGKMLVVHFWLGVGTIPSFGPEVFEALFLEFGGRNFHWALSIKDFIKLKPALSLSHLDITIVTVLVYPRAPGCWLVTNEGLG